MSADCFGIKEVVEFVGSINKEKPTAEELAAMVDHLKERLLREVPVGA